ncbi:MAG TPA: type II toxin-antitoxin system VapC family toxin [Solirubrobacteraceae bacterium]|nr:type II toxin-antitoxin system VapC family toxin [Solirubrobacteraceae bacterium]
MRLLLDTHVFLWLNTQPERLGDRLTLLEAASNELLVSAASTWEIAIKYAGGGLALPEPPERFVPTRIRDIGAEPLAIEHVHALAVSRLPNLHRDPFDRMLIAQAGALDATLVTADERIIRYPVRTLAV